MTARVVAGVRRVRWIAWKAWNRTRYYWPQAQARKRSLARFKETVEAYGYDWNTYRREMSGTRWARKPWWIP